MENVKLKKQVFNKRGGVTKVLPLVIMYHPLLIGDNVSFFTLVSGCFLNKHLYLLHMDEEVKKVFPVAPIVGLEVPGY